MELGQIVDIQELKGHDKNKELLLVVNLPRDLYEIRHHCEYEIMDQRKYYGGREYTLVVGRLGPFLESFYLAQSPDPIFCDVKVDRMALLMSDTLEFKGLNYFSAPWLRARTKEGIVDLWMGLGAGDYDVKDYVEVSYSSVHLGNIFRTKILISALERELSSRNMNWRVSRDKYVTKTEVIVKKPYEVSRNIYLNAHTQKTYGASLTWSPDDYARREEIFFGAGWPSKEEATNAVEHFIRTGEKLFSPGWYG